MAKISPIIGFLNLAHQLRPYDEDTQKKDSDPDASQVKNIYNRLLDGHSALAGVCDAIICDSNVCDTVCDTICGSVCDQVCDNVCDTICDKVCDSVCDCVKV